ncbi:hypothetical protein [Neisseria bacilliformis]|nr:hypothetical protein [Neisseria bacilliformis]
MSTDPRPSENTIQDRPSENRFPVFRRPQTFPATLRFQPTPP